MSAKKKISCKGHGCVTRGGCAPVRYISPTAVVKIALKFQKNVDSGTELCVFLRTTDNKTKKVNMYDLGTGKYGQFECSCDGSSNTAFWKITLDGHPGTNRKTTCTLIISTKDTMEVYYRSNEFRYVARPERTKGLVEKGPIDEHASEIEIDLEESQEVNVVQSNPTIPFIMARQRESTDTMVGEKRKIMEIEPTQVKFACIDMEMEPDVMFEPFEIAYDWSEFLNESCMDTSLTKLSPTPTQSKLTQVHMSEDELEELQLKEEKEVTLVHFATVRGLGLY
jgi:hypothetical protein